MKNSFPKCQAKNPLTCRYHSPFNEELVTSHGVEVVKGKFQTGDFAKTFNTPNTINGYFGGSWEELERLVKKNSHNFEPGTGSVDNDVILVTVPPHNFFTAITKITDDNADQVIEKTYVRQEGEKPVVVRTIKGPKVPAQVVKIVCYRADVLAQDDGRTTNAEWEIVAINAQLDDNTPMHPETMLRNSNHDEGGTLRTYSQKEWDDAYSYWDTHAYLED